MESLTEEELREIKKAVNTLICSRSSFTSSDVKLTEENDKYLELDRKLLKKILKVIKK